ncbi:hypothetical protein EBU71_04605 [bacterium]|nr:hypothetical protein [Candidatus Elulimicrobium humile]
MANNVTSRIKIRGLNLEALAKLKELFPTSDGSNEIDTDGHFKKLFPDVWKGDFDFGWMETHIGSRSIQIEYYLDADDMSQVLMTTQSSHFFPDKWLEKLSEVLTEIHPQVSLSGTYEDEGVEPMGAFVFGLDYSDWEELEVDIDYDIWDDDPDHRDEVFGELYLLRDDLYDAYLLHMEDIGSEQ